MPIASLLDTSDNIAHENITLLWAIVIIVGIAAVVVIVAVTTLGVDGIKSIIDHIRRDDTGASRGRLWPLALTAALLLTLSALFGCAPDLVLTEGEVLSKDYDDPDTWTSLECSVYDSKLNCIFWTTVTHQDGPHWYLVIRGRDKDGKWHEEKHGVTQTLHDLVDIGQYVNLSDQSIVPR